MTLPEIIRYVRIETIAGRHLHHCFAAASVRALGWRRMMAARRIARRLNLKHHIAQ